MSSIFAVAQSGLQVAALRLAVSADDVANVATAGHVARRVDAQERAQGGVSGQVVAESDPEFEARVDRAIAGASGTGAAVPGADGAVPGARPEPGLPISGTHLEREIVEQISASAAFGANLASLRSADEVLEALMRLRR